MKLQYLFVALFTLLLIACGKNGADNAEQKAQNNPNDNTEKVGTINEDNTKDNNGLGTVKSTKVAPDNWPDNVYYPKYGEIQSTIQSGGAIVINTKITSSEEEISKIIIEEMEKSGWNKNSEAEAMGMQTIVFDNDYNYVAYTIGTKPDTDETFVNVAVTEK